MDVRVQVHVRLDENTEIDIETREDFASEHASVIERVALEAVNRAQHAVAATARAFADDRLVGR